MLPAFRRKSSSRDSLPNLVELRYIETPPALRERGWAGKTLRILTALADRFGVTLVLTVAEPDPDATEDDTDECGLPAEELTAWYERHGFQGDRKMWRVPQPRA